MLSAKYEKMFTDFAQVDENEKFRKAGREQECQPILRTDIEAIHFIVLVHHGHLMSPLMKLV